MKVRATLIELWKKVTPFKTQENVFWNGESNSYSEEMELAVGNSPTGSRAKEMFSKFVYGKGISNDLNPKFSNGVLLSEIAKDVIDDVVVQNGAFIHTTYGIDTDAENEVIFMPKQPKSLDYNKCRISKEDDDENKGMILYQNFNKLDTSLTAKQKKQSKKYYPFNPNQLVVMAQINADAKEAGYEGEVWAEKIKHYRGQVMYLNLTPKYRYAISKFDSVYNDLDTEYRVSVYFNTMTRGGFLGKTAVITQGLDKGDDDLVKETMGQWLGPDGSDGIYHLNVDHAEDLDKVLKIIQVKSQFDDKQFTVLMPSLRTNIIGAANNLPKELAFSESGSMFDGGEKYKELKLFYWEQCEWERQKIEEAFEKLGFYFTFLDMDGSVTIVNDATDEVEASPEASEETLQAQAGLRGSVGGVQGILGIQASFSSGVTDFESAITILMEIYGFDRKVSSALLGQPDLTI